MHLNIVNNLQLLCKKHLQLLRINYSVAHTPGTLTYWLIDLLSFKICLLPASLWWFFMLITRV